MHNPSWRAVPALRGIEGYYSLLYVAIAVISASETLDRRDFPIVAGEYQYHALGTNNDLS